MSMSGLPLQVAARISAALGCVEAEFKPGAKVTLLVRNPGVAGGADFVMTNDSLEEAIAELERRWASAKTEGAD